MECKCRKEFGMECCWRTCRWCHRCGVDVHEAPDSSGSGQALDANVMEGPPVGLT
jgi:hypothetical protein